jgi:hypothetical protein
MQSKYQIIVGLKIKSNLKLRFYMLKAEFAQGLRQLIAILFFLDKVDCNPCEYILWRNARTCPSLEC